MPRRDGYGWVYVITGEAPPNRQNRDGKGEPPSERAWVLSERRVLTVQMPDGEIREVTDDDLLYARRKRDPVDIIQQDGPLGGQVERHPSFGMAQITSVQMARTGRRGEPGAGIPIFGSRLEGHRHAVRLCIKGEAEITHRLGEDWYHGTGRTIVEVMFSPARFAEFVASRGSSGVPCSITYHSPVAGPGMIPPGEVERTEAVKVIDRLRDMGKEVAEARQDARKALEDALDTKGVSKARRKAALAAFDASQRPITESLPFLVSQGVRALEERATEAKAEVEAASAERLSAQPGDVIKDSDGVRLTLTHKSPAEGE
jgi:hypothetical protein